MVKALKWLATIAAILAVAAALAACGDDDDGSGDDGGDEAADTAEIEDTATQLFTATEDDIDFFIAHTTADLLAFLGYESEEDCRADAAACIGEPTEVQSLERTEVDGDTGQTTATTPDGPLTLHFVREDDVWKADSLEFGVAEIPEGVTAINVAATEYAYDIEDDIEDGNIAFTLNNEGEDAHELIVMKTADDFDLDALIAAPPGPESEELPPGVEEFVGVAIAGPGDSANLVPEGELASGSYLMICFFDTTDGSGTHAQEGMHQDFEVP